MHRTNKKILYALVVAYKNGIINKKTLMKWTDRNKVFRTIMKYVVYMILFSHLIILTSEGYIVSLDTKIQVSSLLIEAYRLLNVVLIIPVILSTVRVYRYVNNVFYVHRTMKQYCYCPDDIEALDRITYKIKM